MPDISGANFDEVIVLKQCEGESPIELLLRATARVSGLERSGGQVGRAVISMAPLLEPQLAAVRRMIALAVLSHVQAAAQASELVLAIDENSTPELRSDVIALVESLVAHPGSRYAPIRVRFAPAAAVVERPSRPSGVHLVLDPSRTGGGARDLVSVRR